MAANKFATMLHNKNTNKITLILIYTLLEWILILLLLLNSILSYFIVKFARFFGLNPPCFRCARIDRMFGTENDEDGCSHRDHRKLAEPRGLCEGCCSSSKNRSSFVFSKVERIDVIESDDGEDEDEVRFGDDAKVDSDEGIRSDCGEENEDIESEKGNDEENEIEVIRDSNYLEQDLIQFEKEEDSISEIHDVQFFIDYSGNDRLFPFELVDSKTEESSKKYEDDHEFGDFQKARVESELESEEVDESVDRKTEESIKRVDRSLVYHEDLIDFGNEQAAIDEEVHGSDSDLHSEKEVSIGTEIPVLDPSDEIKHGRHPINSDNFHPNLENLENLDEIEEEKAPETPSSIHSLNPLHKSWLIPEPKEAGAEESFDGTSIGETDAEKLKLVLEAERETLRHIYSELEEERNASAVAANETMAMINRLQEEKAAMQMEALHYQRMMEEQSEYDQEALQLLNDLMIKKETELESYRRKVSDYESKEKIRSSQRRSTKTGSSSVSWSHSEDDNDGFSVDFSRESQHRNTPIGSVLDLEAFEEERVSILEQLKVLEEKLFALSDEEDRHFAKVSVIEDHYEEITGHGVNGPIVGFVGNGKQLNGKSLLPVFDVVGTGGEEMTVRNGYEIGFRPVNFEDTAVTRFELEKKRIDMEEEVDQLYGRLQALEADKEFLKHCIGSMRKGEKGTELLQEILQHLRDLRTKSYNDNAFI
ncbi:hypothetical protein OSB04_008930 [Centaurea solstitialis]|uniref:GTD-binding domain-containing protein n=1 Tax=Centaurea solstitialis TaxID=347529 RepID=A0AA38TZH4_9ASTR|nr:hypothetical protein OSB04_008930 [Centaurea solstitialis]